MVRVLMGIRAKGARGRRLVEQLRVVVLLGRHRRKGGRCCFGGSHLDLDLTAGSGPGRAGHHHLLAAPNVDEERLALGNPAGDAHLHESRRRGRCGCGCGRGSGG